MYKKLLFLFSLLFTVTTLSSKAQIRTTYDKNFNLQGGFTYNLSPDFNRFWNYGYTLSISREREFNSGWYLMGGFRYSWITFSDDDFLISTGLNTVQDVTLDQSDSRIYRIWGAIRYQYPLLFDQLKLHALGGLHLTRYVAGSVAVASESFSGAENFSIEGESNGYGGLLVGGGLSYDVLPGRLTLFSEIRYAIGSTTGTDTIFIGLMPLEFGIRF